MKVCVFGGAGYVGSRLVPKLLGEGYEVVVYDTMWFGDGFLPRSNENLKLIKGDIRDVTSVKSALKGVDMVINLACISNDTSCGLDERLSTSVNYDAFEPLVIAAKESGVKRFIFCSSSSVYGSSNQDNVTEDHPLIPLTLYNKYKGMCEPLLFKYQSDDFVCTVIRPATVCGVAPRMRFDLTVNILTNHAINNGMMTVFGGDQKRPNLHIDDMCDVYKLLLKAPAEKINGERFNVGVQNMTVLDIAKLVQRIVVDSNGKKPAIEIKPRTDDRSYHINSDKIFNVLGFRPTRTVELAIKDIALGFGGGKWKDSLTNPIYTNVLQLIQHGFERKS